MAAASWPIPASPHQHRLHYNIIIRINVNYTTTLGPIKNIHYVVIFNISPNGFCFWTDRVTHFPRRSSWAKSSGLRMMEYFSSLWLSFFHYLSPTLTLSFLLLPSPFLLTLSQRKALFEKQFPLLPAIHSTGLPKHLHAAPSSPSAHPSSSWLLINNLANIYRRRR